MTSATALARWLVAELVARGVQDVVLCPGSRNAPLSFALVDRPEVRLHTRIDERTAGFLALGIARSSRRPVAVVTTSGTATANLHPAVLEAAHAGLSLVAVTADRPASLRGTGANQTTDQVRLFGSAASFVDLADPDRPALDGAWLPGGPIQVNVQLSEPLTPADDDSPPPVVADPISLGDDAGDDSLVLPAGPRTVVVAGDGAGREARALAQAAGWPLLAEPSSGSRTGGALRTYRLLLDTGLAAEVERAVVLGHPTLSRPVSRLLGRADVEVVSVRARGRWPARPFAVAAEAAWIEPTGVGDPAWLERWAAADRLLSEQLDVFVADQSVLTPYDVAAAVAAALPPGGLLQVGASNPIRDLDLMAPATPVGERRLVLANRGLAGIDGTVSSAIGAVLGRPATTRALAYVGDVTFLHDLTGLVIGPIEVRPDLTIVVANDDGGSIFATLEQGDPAHATHFEKLFGTPHGADLGAVCAGLGVRHRRVADRASLTAALADPRPGVEVVEATIGRADRRVLDAAIRALA